MSDPAASESPLTQQAQCELNQFSGPKNRQYLWSCRFSAPFHEENGGIDGAIDVAKQRHPLVARLHPSRVLALAHQHRLAQFIDVGPGDARHLAAAQARDRRHPHGVAHVHPAVLVEPGQQPVELVLSRAPGAPAAAGDQLAIVQQRPGHADHVGQRHLQVGAGVPDRRPQLRQFHVDGVAAGALLVARVGPLGQALGRQLAHPLAAEVVLEVLQHVVHVGGRVDRAPDVGAHLPVLRQQLDHRQVLGQHGGPLIVDRQLHLARPLLGFLARVERARDRLAAGSTHLRSPAVADEKN